MHIFRPLCILTRKNSYIIWKVLFIFLSLQRIDGRTGAGHLSFESCISEVRVLPNPLRGSNASILFVCIVGFPFSLLLQLLLILAGCMSYHCS